MKKLISATFAFLLAITACTKDQSGPDGCFQEDILPILVSNCTMAGCHNSKDKRSGIDYSNYSSIMQTVTPKHPLRSELYNSVKGNKPAMPPAPHAKLSAKDVSLIKLWIDKGANNTSNCKTCDSTLFGYGNRVSTIMNAWCVGCHNPSDLSGKTDLSTYAGVLAATAGNKLLGSVKHSPGFIAMPQNGSLLPACDISALQKWSAAGFPE